MNLIPFQNHGESNTVSDLEVVSQLNMIRDKILAKADSQLHNHLMQLDIPLPLFGMYVVLFLFSFLPVIIASNFRNLKQFFYNYYGFFPFTDDGFGCCLAVNFNYSIS